MHRYFRSLSGGLILYSAQRPFRVVLPLFPMTNYRAYLFRQRFLKIQKRDNFSNMQNAKFIETLRGNSEMYYLLVFSFMNLNIFAKLPLETHRHPPQLHTGWRDICWTGTPPPPFAWNIFSSGEMMRRSVGVPARCKRDSVRFVPSSIGTRKEHDSTNGAMNTIHERGDEIQQHSIFKFEYADSVSDLDTVMYLQ